VTATSVASDGQAWRPCAAASPSAPPRVVGLFLGFPAGVYLTERHRLGPHHHAWESTRHALKALGLSILIELTAALLAAGLWLAVVLT